MTYTTATRGSVDVTGQATGVVGAAPGAAPGTVRVRPKMVDGFIAGEGVRRGGSGSDAARSGAVKLGQIPQDFRPDTAINTTDEIAQKVALFDIAPGTIIVLGMFVDLGGPLETISVPKVPTPTVPAHPPGTTADGFVEVYAAWKGVVKRGTPAAAAVASGDISVAKLPAEYRPATAITSADQITGRVALFDISPGTIIVDGMFVPTL